MAVGTGGQLPPPPNILPTPLKNNDINQCIAIRLKYVHSSVDIGNHRYSNVQNCILLKYKCDKKNARLRRAIFLPLPPRPHPPYPKNVPTALCNARLFAIAMLRYNMAGLKHCIRASWPVCL